MNKLSIIFGLAFAAKGSHVDYGNNTYSDKACFDYDESTGEYVAGAYSAGFVAADNTTMLYGATYSKAFDITFDDTTTGKGCYQFIKSDTGVSWTITSGDEASATPMFAAYGIEWALNGTTCEVPTSPTFLSFDSTSTVAFGDVGFCALTYLFLYSDGADSTGTAIARTTQVISFFTDNAVTTVAGLATAAVASMFF